MLPRSLLLVIALAAAAPVGATCAAAQDWTQFRGPDGRAIAADIPMPTDFAANSAQLKWKVPVEGIGISSPIVRDGKVYLTSAYQGAERSRIRGGTIGIMGLLAVLSLVSLALGLRGRVEHAGDQAQTHPAWVRLLSGLDRLAVTFTAAGFAALALVATVQPERLWTSGLPGDAWLVTGSLALAGLVAAFGSFRPRSAARLVGVLVLLGAAAFAWHMLPLNKHREVFKLTYRLVMVAPAVGGAAWFLLLRLLLGKRRVGGAGRGATVAAPGLALMAVALFVSCNYLSPQAGLVRAVHCFELESGEQLWNTPLFVAPEERLHRQNSFATPTPCADGERVFAFFGPGYGCVDLDGGLLWDGRDDGYVANSRYGCVSSPIEFEDLFIINHENEQELRPSYVMALDRETGEQRWRVEPEFAHDSYMTPSLVPVGGSVQLVTVSMAKVASYDPRTGELLWTLDLPTWQHVPSLTYEGDLLFVSGGAHSKWVTAAVRLTGAGKTTQAEVVWQSKRGVPASSSPLLYGGVFVTATDGGILTCYEPDTGAVHWKERVDGSVLSSLVGADGKILVCTEEGRVIVLAAGPEFEQLSSVNLGETIRATPALADGRVLIRTEQHLYCYEGE